MQHAAYAHFQKLVVAIEQAFKEVYPYSPPISEWKGQTIIDFQEALSAKTQGRISEKWFYTHFKSGPTGKLPRIDVLNMLSEYVGYPDWHAFVAANPIKTERSHKESHALVKRPFLWYGLGLVVLLIIVFAAFNWPRKGYEVCFIDDDGGELIEAAQIKMILLLEEESPRTIYCDAEGCIQLKEIPDRLRYVVDGPYYRADTIERRIVQAHYREQISLKKDDYALMIHYFSTAKISDWQKRKKQLESMIDDNARIFQVMEDESLGMEMYNKTEFIQKLILPVNSLRNLKIIETVYHKGKIINLRFTQSLTHE